MTQAERSSAQTTITKPAAEPIPETKRNYAHYKQVFAGQRMPFAFVDLDLFDANIAAIVAHAGEKRIRVASKSVRSVALLRRILAADLRIQGVMCFTAREAVCLAGLGFDDLLIGYPVVHPADLADIARATAAGARITLMVDSVAQVERAERAAREQGVRLPLCLELDMSLDLPGLHFGVWRSPLRTAEQARPVIARIQASEHVWLDGVMGYEAQIAGVGDNTSKRVRNLLIRALKRRSAQDVAQRRAELVALINSLGGQLRFVNGGGTGSLRTTRAEPVVTEITVGSGFYSPALFDSYRDFRYQPAAGFAIEIVRRSQPDIYTCLGGGYVASGSAGKEKLPAVYLPQSARLESLEGAGEVQTPVRYRGPVALDIGDPIFLRHAKAGELCERFTHLLLVQDGKVVETVTTYRGDGQNFL